MANNKKNKSTKTAKKGKSEPTVSPTDVPLPPPVELTADFVKNGFPQSQFAGIVFLSVGMMYLMEYREVLATGNCSRYLINFDGDCSVTDMAMIRTKFHSGILAESLVALTMLLVYRDNPLFTRLNSIVVSSCLITTLLAISTTKEIVHPGKLLRLGLLVTVLLAVAASSIYYADHHVASRRRWTIDLPNATLLTIGIAHLWEVYKFLSAGVFGFLAPSGDEFETQGEDFAGSPPSIALLPYLAVDQLTIVGICIFGAVYLGGNRKRTLLFFLGMIQAVGLFYQLPQMQDKLLDPTYYENFFKGTAIFSLTAAFAPEVVLFTEPEAFYNASVGAPEPAVVIVEETKKKD